MIFRMTEARVSRRPSCSMTRYGGASTSAPPSCARAWTPTGSPPRASRTGAGRALSRRSRHRHHRAAQAPDGTPTWPSSARKNAQLRLRQRGVDGRHARLQADRRADPRPGTVKRLLAAAIVLALIAWGGSVDQGDLGNDDTANGGGAVVPDAVESDCQEQRATSSPLWKTSMAV